MPPHNGHGGQWNLNSPDGYQTGGQPPQYGQGDSGQQPATQQNQYGQDLHAHETDPYAQQYDAYNQSHQQYDQQPTSQQWQPMGQGAPAPGAWNQPPPDKPNRLPLFIAIGIVVLAAIIAGVILLVNINDDSDTNTAGETTTSQATNSSEEETSAETTTEEGGGGGSTNELPGDFPVPDGVEISEVSTQGGLGAAQFTTSDPEGTYDDWLSQLEAAGYELDTPYITGSGDSAQWLITGSAADGTAIQIVYSEGEGYILLS